MNLQDRQAGKDIIDQALRYADAMLCYATDTI